MHVEGENSYIYIYIYMIINTGPFIRWPNLKTLFKQTSKPSYLTYHKFYNLTVVFLQNVSSFIFHDLVHCSLSRKIKLSNYASCLFLNSIKKRQIAMYEREH
ncbi:hypothetical protein NC651_016070 [Populus alba x Populus x berolinensis]|nr:hypothetical protein NC651_016070 [Populus alba x Populus x berolinensis]